MREGVNGTRAGRIVLSSDFNLVLDCTLARKAVYGWPAVRHLPRQPCSG